MYTEQLTQALSIAAAPIHPQSVAVGTANTGGVDMQLFRRATFLLDVGAFGASATVDMKLQESPDNSTFTDLAGTGVSITQLLAGGGNVAGRMFVFAEATYRPNMLSRSLKRWSMRPMY